jgi:hypothetical protein
MVVVCEYDDECIAAMERLVVEQLCASTVVSSIGTAAVTTCSVVARLSFAPDGAHASHRHRQYSYGGRRGACEVRERALGVM